MSDKNKEQAPEAANVAAPTTTEDAKLAAEQAELLKLQIEGQRLANLEKQANIEDIQERLHERQLKRESVRQISLVNGASLKQTEDSEKKTQKRCNHRKGGNGAAGVIMGQGDSLDYAVIKHTMPNSDMWIRCQRCGKTWKPVVREWFNSDAEYLAAVAEYETAKNFPTKNSPSSSYQFRFSDNGAYFREVTRHTTLR